MLEKFRARRQQRKRGEQESDAELREEQEAAERRMGIDPADFDIELKQAKAAPWHRGIWGWGARRHEVEEPGAAPPDEKPG